jgi:cytochrome oxidase Cu insertion factor (SCO1/SenC/PrrC family)
VRRGAAAALAAGVLFAAGAGGVAAHRDDRRPAAVPPAMDFVPPPAGSYRLPVIQRAPDGDVLDAAGARHRLAEYTRGSVTLLSLVYTYCTDPTGCPLAHAVIETLRARVVADHGLRGRARFVSLSFDPVNDTPAAMRAYGGDNLRPTGPAPWHFLTTRSVRDLRPILDGLGQEIEVEVDGRGRPRRTISHMLKLFLIDRSGSIREIYSTAFLYPEAMLNDIRTLVMEESAAARR